MFWLSAKPDLTSNRELSLKHKYLKLWPELDLFGARLILMAFFVTSAGLHYLNN